MRTDKVREKFWNNWNHKTRCFNNLMDKLDSLQQTDLAEEVKDLNNAWDELLSSYLEVERAGITM